MGTIAVGGKAEIVGAPALSAATAMEGAEMKTIDIRRLPELRTRVGIHGSARQQEVGGVFCAGVVIIASSG